jgi:hypothetical protein
MNAIAVCIFLIIASYDQPTGMAVLQATIDLLKAVLKEDGEKLSAFLVAIVFAEPLATDDPVFQREDAAKWSSHLVVFGRASEVLKTIQIEERHRPEALSSLGKCMVYGTHCSSTRFGA